MVFRAAAWRWVRARGGVSGARVGVGGMRRGGGHWEGGLSVGRCAEPLCSGAAAGGGGGGETLQSS